MPEARPGLAILLQRSPQIRHPSAERFTRVGSDGTLSRLADREVGVPLSCADALTMPKDYF